MKNVITRGRRGAYLAVGAVAGAALSGGVAFASIPDAQDQFIGCATTLVGTLRVVDWDAGQRCLPTEKKIVWNATGPVGPQGAAGTDGTDGTDGTNGAPGAAGTDGVSGYEVVSRPVTLYNSTGTTSSTLRSFEDCPAGKKLVGGGVWVDPNINASGSANRVTVLFQAPSADGTRFTYAVKNESGIEQKIEVRLTCALVG